MRKQKIQTKYKQTNKNDIKTTKRIFLAKWKHYT
jgi:hypothetical protein